MVHVNMWKNNYIIKENHIFIIAFKKMKTTHIFLARPSRKEITCPDIALEIIHFCLKSSYFSKY